jgi:DNA-binding PadR family transcriptional regulator
MSLRYGILGLLTYGPMTGYHLKKVFDGSINHMWSASLSQIYRDLGSLEQKGYISSAIEHQEDRPDKKVYTITEEGKTAFHEWLADFPEKLAPAKRDDFMLRVFFGSQLEKTDLLHQFKRFIAQKQKALKMLDSIKNEFSRKGMEAVSEDDKLYWYFTIRRAVLTLEALVAWAEECVQELEKRL